MLHPLRGVCLSIPSVHLSLVNLGFSVWSSLHFLCMESLSTNMASVTSCTSGPAVLETGAWEDGGFVGNCLTFVGQGRMSGKLTCWMYSWHVILSRSVEASPLCCPLCRVASSSLQPHWLVLALIAEL